MRTAMYLALIGAVIGIPCTTALADDLTVKLVSIVSPIGYGEQETLVVQTEAGATCQAHAITKGINFNLAARKAGSDGLVRWSWKTAASSGKSRVGETRQLEVVCTAGDRKGTLQTEFTVR
ncbi:MAG TPA: hypothetical protein VJT33_16645 [bacterium]|nr:hypothetical protein [bacterium]